MSGVISSYAATTAAVVAAAAALPLPPTTTMAPPTPTANGSSCSSSCSSSSSKNTLAHLTLQLRQEHPNDSNSNSNSNHDDDDDDDADDSASSFHLNGNDLGGHLYVHSHDFMADYLAFRQAVRQNQTVQRLYVTIPLHTNNTNHTTNTTHSTSSMILSEMIPLLDAIGTLPNLSEIYWNSTSTTGASGSDATAAAAAVATDSESGDGSSLRPDLAVLLRVLTKATTSPAAAAAAACNSIGSSRTSQNAKNKTAKNIINNSSINKLRVLDISTNVPTSRNDLRLLMQGIQTAVGSSSLEKVQLRGFGSASVGSAGFGSAADTRYIHTITTLLSQDETETTRKESQDDIADAEDTKEDIDKDDDDDDECYYSLEHHPLSLLTAELAHMATLQTLSLDPSGCYHSSSTLCRGSSKQQQQQQHASLLLPPMNASCLFSLLHNLPRLKHLQLQSIRFDSWGCAALVQYLNALKRTTSSSSRILRPGLAILDLSRCSFPPRILHGNDSMYTNCNETSILESLASSSSDDENSTTLQQLVMQGVIVSDVHQVYRSAAIGLRRNTTLQRFILEPALAVNNNNNKNAASTTVVSAETVHDLFAALETSAVTHLHLPSLPQLVQDASALLVDLKQHLLQSPVLQELVLDIGHVSSRVPNQELQAVLELSLTTNHHSRLPVNDTLREWDDDDVLSPSYYNDWTRRKNIWLRLNRLGRKRIALLQQQDPGKQDEECVVVKDEEDKNKSKSNDSESKKQHAAAAAILDMLCQVQDDVDCSFTLLTEFPLVCSRQWHQGLSSSLTAAADEQAASSKQLPVVVEADAKSVSATATTTTTTVGTRPVGPTKTVLIASNTSSGAAPPTGATTASASAAATKLKQESVARLYNDVALLMEATTDVGDFLTCAGLDSHDFLPEQQHKHYVSVKKTASTSLTKVKEETTKAMKTLEEIIASYTSGGGTPPATPATVTAPTASTLQKVSPSSSCLNNNEVALLVEATTDLRDFLTCAGLDPFPELPQHVSFKNATAAAAAASSPTTIKEEKTTKDQKTVLTANTTVTTNCQYSTSFSSPRDARKETIANSQTRMMPAIVNHDSVVIADEVPDSSIDKNAEAVSTTEDPPERQVCNMEHLLLATTPGPVIVQKAACGDEDNKNEIIDSSGEEKKMNDDDGGSINSLRSPYSNMDLDPVFGSGTRHWTNSMSTSDDSTYQVSVLLSSRPVSAQSCLDGSTTRETDKDPSTIPAGVASLQAKDMSHTGVSIQELFTYDNKSSNDDDEPVGDLAKMDAVVAPRGGGGGSGPGQSPAATAAARLGLLKSSNCPHRGAAAFAAAGKSLLASVDSAVSACLTDTLVDSISDSAMNTCQSGEQLLSVNPAEQLLLVNPAEQQPTLSTRSRRGRVASGCARDGVVRGSIVTEAGLGFLNSSCVSDATADTISDMALSTCQAGEEMVRCGDSHRREGPVSTLNMSACLDHLACSGVGGELALGGVGVDSRDAASTREVGETATSVEKIMTMCLAEGISMSDALSDIAYGGCERGETFVLTATGHRATTRGYEHITVPVTQSVKGPRQLPSGGLSEEARRRVYRQKMLSIPSPTPAAKTSTSPQNHEGLQVILSAMKNVECHQDMSSVSTISEGNDQSSYQETPAVDATDNDCELHDILNKSVNSVDENELLNLLSALSHVGGNPQETANAASVIEPADVRTDCAATVDPTQKDLQKAKAIGIHTPPVTPPRVFVKRAVAQWESSPLGYRTASLSPVSHPSRKSNPGRWLEMDKNSEATCTTASVSSSGAYASSLGDDDVSKLASTIRFVADLDLHSQKPAVIENQAAPRPPLPPPFVGPCSRALERDE